MIDSSILNSKWVMTNEDEFGNKIKDDDCNFFLKDGAPEEVVKEFMAFEYALNTQRRQRGEKIECSLHEVYHHKANKIKLMCESYERLASV